MTNRKPAGMSQRDWVEAQLQQAQRSGEFDNLAGAGKPLRLDDNHDPDWWVKDFIRREKIDTEALLPPAVLLRKEKQQVREKVVTLRKEAEVREYLADLNQRIRIAIRDTTGPVVPVGLVNEEEILEYWHANRPARPAPVGPSEQRPEKKSIWQRLFS